MIDLPPPSWLNESFLTQTLEQERRRKQKVKIIRWSYKPAVPDDCNSLSDLYRIKVDYGNLNEDESHSEHSTSLIVKTPKESSNLIELLDKTNMHGREMNIYQDYLPFTYDLHWSRPNAKAFTCNHANILVLEDLQVQGYKTADRLKQLDLAHCRESLTALARFHAISVGVCHRIPESVHTTQEEEPFTPAPSNVEKFSKYCISAMLDTVKNIDGCERYVEILQNTIEQIHDNNLQISAPTNERKVLLHGDVWTNNILFKYNNDGEVVDAKLVDLQQCRFDSFAYDLIVFWWTSASEQVREHHRKEMFTTYRQTFNETLYDIGIKERLTEEQMECELKKYASLTVQVISYILVVAMTDPEEPVDYVQLSQNVLRECTDKDLPQTKLNCSKYYREIIPTVLRQAEEFGAFASSL